VRVSVIIAAFNVEHLIARAVESVRAQTVEDWEAIVIDDASNDGTAAVVAALARKDRRIRLIRHDSNLGPSAARNRGIDAALGEWIAVLDGDDAWRPERLERLLELAAESRADFIADDLIVFDEGYQLEAGVAFGFPDHCAPLGIEQLFPSKKDLRIRARPIAWSASLLKPLIRRGFLLDTNVRYDTRLRSFEDLLFYADLLFHGARAVTTRDAYYVYSMRVGPLSRTRSSGSRSISSPDSLLWVADTVAERYRDQITREIGRGIGRLRRMATDRRISREITHLRNEGSRRDLVVLIAGHPLSAVRYVLRSRTWERAFNLGLQSRARQ
jgi:succinoglycan biosynthesis protein ExoO